MGQSEVWVAMDWRGGKTRPRPRPWLGLSPDMQARTPEEAPAPDFSQYQRVNTVFCSV